MKRGPCAVPHQDLYCNFLYEYTLRLAIADGERTAARSDGPSHRMRLTPLLLTPFLLAGRCSLATGKEAETLPLLKDGRAPRNLEEMWSGFDPRAEPLEVELLKEWEQDDVVLRIVRFRIGVFKGQTARLAAIYGFPGAAAESRARLPGLVQIHGGGQYADHRACLLNAKRGYATVSIAWAGRISAPGYRVSPDEVKLFWEGKTDDPRYRLTTDWGAVDGYHAPGRNAGNSFPSLRPASWTLDGIESPRNSGWFLCALAARRALTFLEQQPEVDPKRLGVYGHSMGGKLTVLAAVDSRVRAAAPSCGGISDRDNEGPLFRATLGDDVSLEKISCPVIFLSPANDFHGRIGDLPEAVGEVASDQWRVICSPHHNHQDTPEYEVATMLWFDHHLKGSFVFPQTPETELNLDTGDGVPVFTVRPDPSKAFRSVDIFYTQHGKADERPQDHENTKHRFWHHARATEASGRWTAKLPLSRNDRPLWVYANVLYPLEAPVTGAGYYYQTYTAESLSVSSLLQIVSADAMLSASVRSTMQPSLLIESFEGDWQKEWFTCHPVGWARTTHKLYDEVWKAPSGASLALDVRARDAGDLIVAIDGHAAEVPLRGGGEWQAILLRPRDFRDATGAPLADWSGNSQLTLAPMERPGPQRGVDAREKTVGGTWRGEAPRFRNLRWQLTAPDSPGGRTSSILDVFPESVAEVPPNRKGEMLLSARFTASGSSWDERLDERTVFRVELDHRQGPDSSFRLRVGRGGQIYSLRGPFGESVPPSWRASGRHLSPWNDEVWQFVAVCTTYNGVKASLKVGDLPADTVERMENSPYQSSYFIHSSGAYVPADVDIESLYCPELATAVRTADRSFRTLNWGLVPQVRTVHRSPLLFYTQVRDVGDGIVELTWVIHNFSVRDDIVFDHLNAPWGGTRVTSLPCRYVSSPAGRAVERQSILDAAGVVPLRKTGGWNLSCASEATDSPSLALVYGQDRHLERERARKAAGEPFCQFTRSLYRDWRAAAPLYHGPWKDWKTRPANSFRNYDVCEVIPRLRIRPQTTIWYRSFLVVGRKARVIELSRSLVDKVDYGLLTFDPEKTPLRSVSVSAGKVEVDGQAASGTSRFEVFTRPVSGTRPLFLIRSRRTGQQVVTTDPYYFVKKARLDFRWPSKHPHHDYYRDVHGYSMDRNDSDWQSLLGFGFEKKPAHRSWKRLSALVDPPAFPETNRYHLDLWVRTLDEEK